MSVYATKAEIQKQAIEPDSLASVSWETLTGAASRIVDRLSDVPFNFFGKASGSPTSRTFYGDGTALLLLDPYAAATDPVVTMESGYNEPTWIQEGDEGRQYLVVNEELKQQSFAEFGSWVNRSTGWPDRVSVSVSADWGFTSIPDDVKQATIEIALHTFRKADLAKLTVDGIDPTIANREVPPTVKLITDELRARYSRKFAFI